MKLFLSKLMLSGAIMLSGCQTQKEDPATGGNPIGKSPVTVTDGLLTAEILQNLGRVGGVAVSPDQKQILFGVSYSSIAENKSNRELFTMNIDGSNKQQITHTPKSEQNAVWIEGGKKIAFLSVESGSSQIWTMNADGSGRKQASNRETGIDGFVVAPDGTKLLFFSNVKYGRRTADLYPDLPKATGRIVGDLMYKHWDEWVETIPHPHIAAFKDGQVGAEYDILEGQPYECPMKPFGGTDDFAWTPDSRSVAYTCRKKSGKEYAFSTNSDIYLFNTETKETRNLTEGLMGYDTYPRFSPDGKRVAWLSMERDGYESDKNRILVQDLDTGEKSDLTQDFDYSADLIRWADNESLYFLAVRNAVKHIYRIDRTTRQIAQLTEGAYDYASAEPAGNRLIALRHSLSAPDEIYCVSTEDKSITELSFENKEVMDQLTMGKVEERWITTTDNKKMLTWVVYPPHFDPNKKYPALLYCQGGPQSPVSQFWSYRWNLQLMAAHGYIVIAPNRRGLPGFGQEWLEQISGDYGGQNMRDYLSATDELKKESYIDADRLGAIGASYGGFSVYWLAGNHQNRFKAFIAHAGIFNLEQQYVETEEMWFANWDLGGPFWDKSNATAQRSYANSPHRFVQNWDTPILVTHGELDYRILASQGMAAFNAAIMRGIPAEMVVFPDENHWVLQPQNGILWQRVFFRWLDHWLKDEQPKSETSDPGQ